MRSPVRDPSHGCSASPESPSARAVARRRRLITAALAAIAHFAACHRPAAPSPPAPPLAHPSPAPAPPSSSAAEPDRLPVQHCDNKESRIPSGPKDQVIRRAVDAYEIAGHHCAIDRDGHAVCDASDSTLPTTLMRYTEESGRFGLVFGTSRKLDGDIVCSDLDSLVIAKPPGVETGLQLNCEGDMLTAGVGIPIPPGGITVRELNRNLTLGLILVTTTLLELMALQRARQAPSGTKGKGRPAGKVEK